MSFYGNLSGATGRSSGSEEAKGIKYTDTMSIGGTNVQAVLDIIADKVLNGLLTKEEAEQISDALDTKITGNGNRIDTVESRINSLAPSIEQNSNNISAIFATLDTIPSSNIVTFSGADVVKYVVNNAVHITNSGIWLMDASSRTSMIIGLTLAGITESSAVPYTPLTIGKITGMPPTTNMNTVIFRVSGDSSNCQINGVMNDDAEFEITISTYSGGVAISNYETICVPPLLLFH